LEQDPKRILYAGALEDQPLSVGFPPEFSAEEPTTLTRVWLRQPFSELSVPAGEPLERSPAPSRTVDSLTPIVLENSTILNVDVPATFVRGDASPWILQHPLPRPARCPRIVREEVAARGLSPRDLISVNGDVAVGMAVDRNLVFRADGTVTEYPHPDFEVGRALAQGSNSRTWVVTASSAAVLDLEGGLRSEEVRFTSVQAPIGMGEDPESGDLFILSQTAELWKRGAGEPTFTSIGALTAGDARLHSFHKAIAHFVFHGGGRFSVVSDQIAGVVEVEQNQIFVRRPETTSEGFSSMLKLESGALVLADAKVGGLFQYELGSLRFLRPSSSGIVGLLPVDGLDGHVVYLTTYALLGTLDLRTDEFCPESVLGSYIDARAFVRIGNRHIMGGQSTDREYGWWWLDLEY
jgi:hypothetical protein